jgi:hypothetical protein
MSTFTNTIKHGRRAHTIGDYFPFRVMGEGELDSLKWWVIHPKGNEICYVSTVKLAVQLARVYHARWCKEV